MTYASLYIKTNYNYLPLNDGETQKWDVVKLICAASGNRMCEMNSNKKEFFSFNLHTDFWLHLRGLNQKLQLLVIETLPASFPKVKPAASCKPNLLFLCLCVRENDSRTPKCFLSTVVLCHKLRKGLLLSWR